MRLQLRGRGKRAFSPALPPLFANERKDLFDQLAEIPGLNISGLDSDVLCSTLLFGSSDLNVIENRIVLDATISFINRTGRF